MSKRVFISYSRDDYGFVERLVGDLTARGVRTWLDQRDIPAGQRWDNAIRKALRECEYFLVVLSPTSVASENVLDEVAYAMSKKKPVFPVLAQKCDIPYRLARVQYVDFQKDYDHGLEDLMEDLVRAGVPIEEEPDTLPETAAKLSADKVAQTMWEELFSQTEKEKTATVHLTITSPIHLELVRVPAGEFLMGSDPEKDEDAEDNEQPQHRLFLPEFFIGRYPVTVAQFQAFVDDSGYEPANTDRLEGGANHPVTRVTWHDTVAFCEWLSRETGKRFRLPSEAEWEKAARGEDGRIYPWGDDFDQSRLNSEEYGPGTTTRVGRYSPGGDSPYGAADMAGNVWEWCADWYDEERGSRVLRGGSFGLNAGGVRCALRHWLVPFNWFGNVGFRVALSPS